MKQDCLCFATLPIARYFNFAAPNTAAFKRGDPFLIQCSLAETSGAGAANKIRLMRNSNAKSLLPLS